MRATDFEDKHGVPCHFSGYLQVDACSYLFGIAQNAWQVADRHANRLRNADEDGSADQVG